tara:strand:- start:2986 stop:3369 length:384 start_codon:yes stop_codon:yes gene_type:complete
MTRRSFRNIPLPRHVREAMQRSVEWDGGEMVIGIVYEDDTETDRAWVGRDGGSAWAGGRLMRLLLQDDGIKEDSRHRLRLLGTCLDETYGTGTRWDCGQSGSHINERADSRRYPVKLFIPNDQEQFE